MRNFIQHKKEIIDNFCNTFRKITYKILWGIDLNCNLKVAEFSWLDKEILKYQEVDDCCIQCTTSHLPQNVILSQKAVFTTNPIFPFIPLVTLNTTPVCNYIPIGDFNSDFNSDFFK